MCRDGLRSSPGNLCREAEILGLLRSPSRHKAAPTRGLQLLRVGPSLAEQISPVANGGCPT
ncbi:hypothetical protein EFK07_16870 [Pseudomonas putida]|uniref:Uncharacterized protein n=1 Tax=Pseudomonas putida TaxID=303 RepID=A0A3M8T150_PSEPU|nr:hypothetical protein EFK07_16870 [Pseudomonas putida]